MSSAAATQPQGAGGLRAGAVASAATTPWWLAPANLLMAGFLTVGFFGLFFRWFLLQNKHSFGSQDWMHAYVVPLISGWVIWKRRDEIERLTPSVFWPGLLPMALGIGCYFFFLLTLPNHMLQGFSIVLSLAGLVLLMLGARLFPIMLFPVAYLAFGVTIAEMVMLKLTAKLQVLASAGAELLMNMLAPLLGTVTERAGNVLTITTKDGSVIPLNVAEACSGMRMLIAFYALGVAFAFISCRHWWQRVALLLLAGPIAILVNVFRVAFLGVASIWDPSLASGDAHMFIGVLWLVPAFLLFLGVVGGLKRIVKEQPDAGPAPAGGAA